MNGADGPEEDARPAPAGRPTDRWRVAVAIAVPVLIVAALIAVFVTRDDEPQASGEDPLIQYCATAIERDSIELPVAAQAEPEEAAGPVPVAAGRMVLLTERMLEYAPEDVRPELEAQIAAYRELVRTSDPAGFVEAGLLESLNKVGRAAASTCSMQQVEFAASQFRYRDFPRELDSGRTSFLMRNEANERHQMVLFRRNPEFTGSFADVLERGKQDEEATRIATGQADPDELDVMAVELFVGDYALTCFIESGTEVHWEMGEIAEFSVG